MPKARGAAKGSGFKRNPNNTPVQGRKLERLQERRSVRNRSRGPNVDSKFWSIMQLQWHVALFGGLALMSVSLLSRSLLSV